MAMNRPSTSRLHRMPAVLVVVMLALARLALTLCRLLLPLSLGDFAGPGFSRPGCRRWHRRFVPNPLWVSRGIGLAIIADASGLVVGLLFGGQCLVEKSCRHPGISRLEFVGRDIL